MVTAELPPLPRGSLIDRVFRGPQGLRAGWRLLIFLAIVTAILAGRTRLLDAWLPRPSDTKYLVRIATEFCIFLFASWIMARIEHRSIAEYGLPWRQKFRGRFWKGALLGFAAISTLVAGMRVAGVLTYSGVALHGAAIAKWAALYAFAFVFVGLREEFRARGYSLYTLTTGIGFWPAAVLSAIYFGASHYHNHGENGLGLFNVGLFGLFACFLLRRTGDLWMPIGMHMAFDWGETFFYGVPDSGTAPERHLLNTAIKGPAWLSGGTVGPEGSILCTVTMLALWWVCSVWLRDTRYPAVSGALAIPGAAPSAAREPVPPAVPAESSSALAVPERPAEPL